jgi:hypothetical protein
MYCYPSRGFEIDASQGKVDAFVIDWDVPAEGPYRPFGGSFVFRGRGLSLGPHTREEDFVRTFGAPYFRAPEAQEAVLFYEFDTEIEWQVEFARDGHLKGMLIVTPPLLSDPERRESYGVACPWPPPRAGPAPDPRTEGGS